MKIEIVAGGVSYPCAPSMGAMLRFKQETGKEITQIDGGSMSELCTYLYCCVVSACAREKREFPFTLIEFADNVTPEDMAVWKDHITSGASEEESEDDAEKKSRPGS